MSTTSSTSTPTTATALLANGVRLPYAECGDPDGAPLVLLHGVTDSWRSFETVLEHLPAGVHAYAVTQRGHGEASRPGSYRLEDMVEDVAAFLDAVGLPSATICGHSLGSIVATRFAIVHPDRTDGLVIMGGAPSWSALGLEDFMAELDTLSDPLDLDYLRGFQESTLAQPVPSERIDIAVAESAKFSIHTFRAVMRDTALQDFSAELGSISAPTLAVWGDQDAYCPRSAQDGLIAAIPGARLSVYEGAGHTMQWEEPARFAADLAAFVAEVAS